MQTITKLNMPEQIHENMPSHVKLASDKIAGIHATGIGCICITLYLGYTFLQSRHS